MSASLTIAFHSLQPHIRKTGTLCNFSINMVDVQQHSQTNNRGMELRFKEEPWCGKHISSGQESTMAKNVYNYAQKNRNTDKAGILYFHPVCNLRHTAFLFQTPMCRIAELARFHKLKHEYILLDESGPAHKKQFTVKLVLKAGEEYEGVGPSIKKAQQSAAENALFGTALQLPPRRSTRSKNGDSFRRGKVLSNILRNKPGVFTV